MFPDSGNGHLLWVLNPALTRHQIKWFCSRVLMADVYAVIFACCKWKPQLKCGHNFNVATYTVANPKKIEMSNPTPIVRNSRWLFNLFGVLVSIAPPFSRPRVPFPQGRQLVIAMVDCQLWRPAAEVPVFDWRMHLWSCLQLYMLCLYNLLHYITCLHDIYMIVCNVV